MKAETGGKCAYCEAPTSVVAHGDVEHFRPKSIYWWLALTFDNYLYSCQLCNQSYKSDNFPISGPLVSAPVMPASKPTGTALDALAADLVLDATVMSDLEARKLWATEDADLPNPYLEDPAPLFAYEVDPINKEVWLRSSGGERADRAAAAVNVFLGLNREELRRERFVHYRALVVLRRALDWALPDHLLDEARQEIRQMQDSTEPFAGMRRWFAAKWGLPGPLS